MISGQGQGLMADRLLVRVRFIMVMIMRTELAPWEFEFPFQGSLTSTVLFNLRSMDGQVYTHEDGVPG